MQKFSLKIWADALKKRFSARRGGKTTTDRRSTSFSLAKSPKILAILLGVAILIIIYLSIGIHFARHFFPNTSINGIAVGGKSASSATETLNQNSADYALTLHFRGGETETISGKSIGYSWQVEGSTEKLLKNQVALEWPVRIFGLKSLHLDVRVTFDEDALNSVLNSLSEVSSASAVEPKADSIGMKDGKFTIVKGTEGTKISASGLKSAVVQALSSATTSLDLDTAEGVYEEPSGAKTESELQEDLEDINRHVSSSVVYTLPDGSNYTLDGSTTKDWIAKNDDGSYTYDADVWQYNIALFIGGLAQKVDTVNTDHLFDTTGKGTIVLNTGSYYGTQVNQYGEIAQLLEELDTGGQTKRDILLSSEEEGTEDENHCIGTNYIEIDIARQHLWMYKNGSRLLDTDVVTGTADGEHDTPTGMFKLISKQKDATLRGAKQVDGNFAYETHVNYWMKLTEDGVGLHDAWWRSSFGGSIYTVSGSHGCINLPEDIAPTVYDNIDDSTVVVIYNSDTAETVGTSGANLVGNAIAES